MFRVKPASTLHPANPPDRSAARHRSRALALLCAVLLATTAQADWRDLGGNLLKGLSDTFRGETPAGPPALGEADAVAGLKEALAVGARIAVGALGREDGFLGNDAVRIPLPDSLQTIGRGMRRVGLGRHVDAFETSMNRAAEAAVPEALELLAEAVRGMRFEDAMDILRGPDDAATAYFREQSGSAITTRFAPIVERATASVGVTRRYQELLDEAGYLSALFNPDDLDLNRYVTDKAVDALFLMLAREELRIREDPLARSSELLQRVFGSR